MGQLVMLDYLYGNYGIRRVDEVEITGNKFIIYRLSGKTEYTYSQLEKFIFAELNSNENIQQVRSIPETFIADVIMYLSSQGYSEINDEEE